MLFKKLRINFVVISPKVSGGVKAIFEYANRLKALGNEVKILLYFENFRSFTKAKFQSLFFNKNFVDWFNLQVPVIPIHRHFFIPKADVIVATFWRTAKLVNHLPLKFGKKVYFVQHIESLWAGEPSKVDETYTYNMKFIVLSSWIANYLKSKFSKDSIILPTPVNTELIYNSGVRSKYDMNKIRVGIMYHNYDWKGFKEGFTAYKMVKEEFPNVELIILSALPPPKELEAFEIWYKPPQEKLRDFYSSLDIFLCPSWFEGLGMPSMEAMACKIPVITTDNGGCREYAENLKTAIVVPPKDVLAIKTAIIRLIKTPELRNKLGENGYQKVMQFDWDSQVRKFYGACLDICYT